MQAGRKVGKWTWSQPIQGSKRKHQHENDSVKDRHVTLALLSAYCEYMLVPVRAFVRKNAAFCLRKSLSSPFHLLATLLRKHVRFLFQWICGWKGPAFAKQHYRWSKWNTVSVWHVETGWWNHLSWHWCVVEGLFEAPEELTSSTSRSLLKVLPVWTIRMSTKLALSRCGLATPQHCRLRVMIGVLGLLHIDMEFNQPVPADVLLCITGMFWPARPFAGLCRRSCKRHSSEYQCNLAGDPFSSACGQPAISMFQVLLPFHQLAHEPHFACS